MSKTGAVALIVGAASGLARRSAIRWAEQGGVVMAADRDEVGLESLARSCPNIETSIVDVVDQEQVARLVESTEQKLGPIVRVDNAAAIFPTSLALDMPIETFHRVSRINYGGLVNVSLTALPYLLRRKNGILVNYCSIAGLIPYMHLAAYSAAKHAAVAFTEILYHENRHQGVSIICLCPPSVETPLLDQAESRPNIVVKSKPMKPDQVLDRLDQTISANRFWCLPSTKTKLLYRLRRMLPSVCWAVNHRIEKQ